MIGPDSRNVALLREKMETERLDGVVALSKSNVLYLSNVPTAWSWQQTRPEGPRICVVVWPREGDPAVIVGELEREVTLEYSWIQRVECYPDYAQTPLEKLVEVLDDLKLRGKRVGIERKALSGAQWEYLAGAHHETTFLDAGQLLNAVRAQKTPAEIELFRRACRLLDRAFLSVFASVRPGITELDLHVAVQSTLLGLGASDILGGLLTGDRAMVIHRPAIRRSLGPGDIIRTDYVAVFDGRAANLGRMAIVGEPSAKQRANYKMLRDIERGVFAQLKAGVRASSIFQYYVNQLKERNLTSDLPLLGHSIGTENHEEPMIIAKDTGTLEAGMVICVEPFVLRQYTIQDQLLVTDSGTELLSPDFDTTDLFVID